MRACTGDERNDDRTASKHEALLFDGSLLIVRGRVGHRVPGSTVNRVYIPAPKCPGM